MKTLIRITHDGRKVEVIDGAICLEGREEARELVALSEHFNRQTILKAVPDAAYMAGRLALTQEEATRVLDALTEAQRQMDFSPRSINRRLQTMLNHRAKMEGVE